MAIFDDVFNARKLQEMLFFNIKAVLIYPTLKDLEEKNKPLFERWEYLSKTKHDFDLNVVHYTAGTLRDETSEYGQKIYEDNAVNYPEYCKIVAITYATVYYEKADLKRYMQKIANENEEIIIASFMNVLNQLSSEGVKSNPQYFPILTGHNIIAYDIPLLIKRFLLHRNTLEDKNLPFILKRALGIKPWESGIMDVVNVWKFNGFEYTSLMLISDYLGLKKTVDLLSNNELSKYYWDNVKEKPKETLEFVSLQSATQTNLVIQLLNLLRQI
jgi:hypothetical protein